MIKRIGSMCCVMMLMICMLLISADNALAAQQDPILDGSYLTHDEESIGYDMKITRLFKMCPLGTRQDLCWRDNNCGAYSSKRSSISHC